MARILAFDYGTRRTGVAETDDLQMIASPLVTLPTHEILDFIRDYVARHPVSTLVVGDPTMDGTAHEQVVKGLREFLKKLAKRFPEIPVETVDERFTSQMAVRSMVDSGAKKKARRDKSNIDKISAAIILQDYLELKK